MTLGSARTLPGIVTSPRLYVVWAALVLVALTAGYFADPYIFAFTTLGLIWISGGIGLVGLWAAVFSRTVNRRARAWIIVSLAVSAAALAAAIVLLGTFRWA
jgi:hypothetical protein